MQLTISVEQFHTAKNTEKTGTRALEALGRT